ncbi:NTP transferase domain-containing protein [Neobacillus pocheonensis]|uniref:NTP transferase domain-containing protein n=1 Tax=Neobacillus pocheonensis TaxID=363869 RepID=UPI003D29E89F
MIAIYLAAGESRRMKAHKLALPLGKTTVGNSGLQTVLQSNLDYIFVITREADALTWIDSELFLPPFRNRWTPLSCSDSVKGQAYSLRRGLLAALDRKPEGIMVLLADQPFLSLSIINDLILSYRKHKKNVGFVAARFQGIPRPPIIFSTEVIPALLKLQGDEGARKLLLSQELAGKFVDYENARDFLDIDTKEDYEKVKGGYLYR